MRVFAIVLGAVAVAVAVAVFLSMSGNGLGVQAGGTTDVNRERLDALEWHLQEVQRHLDELNAAVVAIEDELAALGERMADRAAQQNELSGSDAAASPRAAESEPSGGEKEAPSDGHTADFESLRKVVREEIKRAEQERQEQATKRRQAQQPEEWERKEFGSYAWLVHSTGEKLGLTDEQKRQYYTIIKDYQERAGSLWSGLRKEFPGSDWRELSNTYRERSKELLQVTREDVTDILTGGQQKKYRELCKSNEWFK